MINTRWKKYITLIAGLLMFFAAGIQTTRAQSMQEAFTMTVTPPLFQLSLSPGERWSSQLKVVNNNPYNITVYGTVTDFRATGEGGRGAFLPLPELAPKQESTHSLGTWIAISSDPIIVPAEQSANIPFTINVPENAEPGGHYAAILVGTRPPKTEGSMVSVSSMISSLLFVRVGGNIVEEGVIREFSNDKTFYKKPEVTFTVRFENKGNVHLLPQGNITIYNMWGKQRGIIPINQDSDFGNVLPDSIRKFIFTWEGDENFFEIGRYKAVATIAYGEELRKNTYRTVYFWIVPFEPVLKIGGSALLFLLFFVWVVRGYIRRALSIEAKRLGYDLAQKTSGDVKFALMQKHSLATLASPIKEGVVDLRRVRNEVGSDRMSTVQFVAKYKLFFLSVLVLIVGIGGLVIYLSHVLVPERDFDVKMKTEEGREIIYEIKNESILHDNKDGEAEQGSPPL